MGAVVHGRVNRIEGGRRHVSLFAKDGAGDPLQTLLPGRNRLAVRSTRVQHRQGGRVWVHAADSRTAHEAMVHKRRLSEGTYLDADDGAP